ncbi:MAG: exodeoxyribonuclease V subunit gamma [Propionibacteriaceae bacterium]|jgi:exodeoxyribonuclease V gamma subunit|nr:exodeoxyribonuclease V subunit gamma [Propionibacteriaceae bacterium]
MKQTPDIRLYQAATAKALAAQLVSTLSFPGGELFQAAHVVVPSAGMRRWLSQEIACSSLQICAGVEFSTFSELESLTWPGFTQRRLILAVQAALERAAGGSCPQLAEFRDRLGTAGEPITALGKVARLFLDYARHRPDMLRSWEAGDDVDASGAALGRQSWQAQLWREVAAGPFGSAIWPKPPKPPKLPQTVAVFCPNAWSKRGADIIASLAADHQVELYQVLATPSLLAGVGSRTHLNAANPLNQALAQQSAELSAALRSLAEPVQLDSTPPPDTLLGWLQADLRADSPPQRRILDPGDRSISIHLSHGLDRQVEVLRDAIAAALAADPSLEPRDIAIITPDVERVAPLITANFGLGRRGERIHPAHGFRVRLASRSIWQDNPLAKVLLRLLRLPDSRIGASEILDLCAEPAIARRFGFGPDELTRLGELVQRAEIRWGLNAAHRSRFGLDIAQNTWIFGIQRLALSVAMSDHDLDCVGNISPIDDVDSSDIPLIGAIGELIRRLAIFTKTAQADADIQTWVQRCHTALNELTDAESNHAQQIHAALASMVEDACGIDGPPLNRKAIIAVIEADFADRPTRASFGNGSAIVAGLSQLRWVPHRVVCLLGWDNPSYPRRQRQSGDDLLAASPMAGDPDSLLDDRQALTDAIQAATQSLIVVCQGRSEVTNLPVALSGPIAEFTASLDATAHTSELIPAGCAVTRQHPLQPFSPKAYSGPGPISFDTASFAGAKAAQRPDKAEAVNRFTGEFPAFPSAEPIDLGDLVNFFAHPARQLFRLQAGFTLTERPAPTDDIPIRPDPLQTWTLGRRYIDLRLSGHSPERINRALWLSGSVPPAKLGDTLLRKVNAEARRVLERVPALAEPQIHDIAVELEGCSLFGRVTTRNNMLLATEFSNLQAKHRLAAWIRLLALSAGVAGDWWAITVTKSTVERLAAPKQGQARLLLAELAAIYRYGISHPIPALPRLNEYWSMLGWTGQDPSQPQHNFALRKRWEWESDPHWTTFFNYPELLDLPVPTDFPLSGSGKFQALLATRIWEPLYEHEVPK